MSWAIKSSPQVSKAQFLKAIVTVEDDVGVSQVFDESQVPVPHPYPDNALSLPAVTSYSTEQFPVVETDELAFVPTSTVYVEVVGTDAISYSPLTVEAATPPIVALVLVIVT